MANKIRMRAGSGGQTSVQWPTRSAQASDVMHGGPWSRLTKRSVSSHDRRRA